MFYAYRTDEATTDAGHYRELQLRQFPSAAARDAWCEAYSAKPVKVRDIPARHMSLFRQFGTSLRSDGGGFWGVVDSGTN